MIKLVLLDVDGTLTDGGIYRGNNGEELKRFNVKDGYAIVNAQKLGIEFGIITGRKSELVEIRSNELKIKYLYQGISEKTVIVDFVSGKNGGSGAVREFVEYILKKDGKWETFLKNVK